MSAIAGIFRFDGGPADRRDLERMMNALRAHGPDRSGLHATGPIALGHVLMRLTPEDTFEAQPVRGASGAILVADLRLDNRNELVAALGLDAQQAAFSPDSAIALAAWEKWGDEAWARLRGPFAAAVWDPRHRRLTLARDPLGLRALCYHRGRDFLAFATMPKGLFALADVPFALDKEKFADFLILNLGDGEASLFRDVCRLRSAHIASVDIGGGMNKRQYWGEQNIQPIRLGSDQAYADAMRERLDIAVRRQLRTMHRVGCFLSGGLDSSSIAVLAARALAEQGKRLPAYTQVPEADFESPINGARYFDERPYVEAIRAMIENLDVTYVCSGEHDDFADLDRISRAIDGPVRNVSNMGWIMQIYRLAQAANQRVLLGGDIGNLTISWDGWDQAFYHLMRGRLWPAVRQWRLFYQISTRSPLGAFRQLFIDPSRLVAPPIVQWARRLSVHSAINPEFARGMHVLERAKQMSREAMSKAASSALSVRLNTMIGFELRGEFDAGMLALYGVDLRDPTSDLDVVQYCLGIPDEQYLAEGIHRSVIRRAMWGLLPVSVLANRKRGNQAADWFAKLSRGRQTMTTEIARLRASPLSSESLDLARLEQMLASWPDVSDSHRRKVMSNYQLALPRALAAGRFLQLVERNNLAPTDESARPKPPGRAMAQRRRLRP
jgi:asparagine synthase (glutamine-hydrolysing)